MAEIRTLFVEVGVEAAEYIIERRGDALFAGRKAVGDGAGALGQRLVQLLGALDQRRVQAFGIGFQRGRAGLEFAEQALATL